jgi:hypothetical protein
MYTQKRCFTFVFVIIALILLSGSVRLLSCSVPDGTKLRAEVAFPDSVSTQPLTGRMFFIISRTDRQEPRLQVGRYGTQFFGVDFESLKPGKTVVFDGTTLGYPINALKDIPAGEYYVQAVLNKYTKFERSDGYIVWMHNDQWEGQNWRRSPDNVYSDVKKVSIDPEKGGTIKLTVNHIIPPIQVPEDTKWVKRIKIQSTILTKFWGQPMYIGATILLPRGYDDHSDVKYPTVYNHGHFSSGAPFGFSENPSRGSQQFNEFSREWLSDNFPRFIAVTVQHPTQYFDDSYAVNSANNGPYGDAIHQELIPEIERQFRCIPEAYARVLTGGSTGGWESFALQVFYPDFYGGTWSFSPDPLDFRNVEGINIYADKNAFYKEYEWYRVPTINTRIPATSEAQLTSQQRNTMELVNGTKGRSGEQLDIWSAVFGPVGEDGYFKPLFDKATGVIDSAVAQYWKEHYDLRYYLETHWKEIGSKLVGKLNIISGHNDNFFLNVGVYHMERFLENTKDPYYAGTVTYGAGPNAGHGYRPYTSAEMLRMMAEHITKNAPRGANAKSWKY